MSQHEAVYATVHRVLTELGFERLREVTIPSWRATREGQSLVAIDFTHGAQPLTLTLQGGARNPIDAYLRVDPRGGTFRLPMSGRVERPAPTHTTGDTAFDARFEVFAWVDGDEVVPAMLDASVRRELLALPERVGPILMGEQVVVSVALGDPAAEERLLREVVPRLWQLSTALDDATRALPVPEPLRAHFGAFERAANDHGMRVTRNAVGARKEVGTAEICVTLRAAEARVGRLPLHLPPAGVELLVGSEAGPPGHPEMRATGVATRLLRAMVTGGARTGDSAFDRAWTFRAEDPDAARRWLTADVRAALEALRRAELTTVVHAVGVDATGPLPDSDALVPSLLPHLEVLARSLNLTTTPFR